MEESPEMLTTPAANEEESRDVVACSPQTKGANPKDPNMTMLQEENMPRFLPPLVQTPEMNERTMEIACKIVEKVLPAAQPGRLSTISSKEIENGIDVCAFALCWYLAAFRDPFRRNLLTKNFLDKVFSLVCSVEAAAISIAEGIDIGEALSRVAENVERAASANRDDQASPAVKRPRNRRLRSRGKHTAQQKETNPATNETRSRRLPPLVIWPFIRKGLARQVAHLLSDIDGETTPEHLSTTSDESIEELARASHLALCWFVGSLGDMSKADQIALQWIEDVPRLVGLTCAIVTAEQPALPCGKFSGKWTSAQSVKLNLVARAAFFGWMQTGTLECRARRKSSRKWTK
jgi:hypothetical protein